MILIADVFLNLPTPENVVRQVSKKSSLRVPFKNQHGNQAEKNVEAWTATPLQYLLIPVKTIQVEKISLGDMNNLRTVC